MAEVRLIFRDEDDGSVNLVTEFDPPMRSEKESTVAQRSAWMCVKCLAAASEGLEAFEDFASQMLDELEGSDDSDE